MHRPVQVCDYPEPMPSRTRKLTGQSLRYLVIGGTTTAVQLGLIWLLTRPIGASWAFVISWAVCTLASTVGHRLFTFRRHIPERRDQLVGYATALVSLGANSLALAVLDPQNGLTGSLIVIGINTTIGIARFVLLRLWFLSHLREEATCEPADDQR